MSIRVMEKSEHQLSLLFGGASAEHEVSVESFRFILNEIGGSTGLKPVLIGYVDHDFGVRLSPFDHALAAEDYMAAGERRHIFDALRCLKDAGAPVLNLLIGQYGEDGKLQGAAHVAGLEGTFGGVLPNALAMSKVHMNTFVEGCRFDLSTPRSCSLHRNENMEHALCTLRNTLATDDIILKPNSSGSSLLAHRLDLSVLTREALALLLEDIFRQDTIALAQEFVSGREFTAGCFAANGHVIPLPIVEIHTRNGFFSHEDKYEPGAVEENFLAEGDPLAARLKRLSVALFERGGMNNACRFDYIVKNDQVFFLEANTIPGMTVNSIFPKMIRKSGLSITEYLVASLFDLKNCQPVRIANC